MVGELLKRNKNEENKKYSIIHWQTGEPELTGNYLVTFKVGPIVLQARYVKDVGWETWEREEISAWCKLLDIEPYREEKK